MMVLFKSNSQYTLHQFASKGRLTIQTHVHQDGAPRRRLHGPSTHLCPTLKSPGKGKAGEPLENANVERWSSLFTKSTMGNSISITNSVRTNKPDKKFTTK